ncbi:YczE/YyaS/YitT family protein [Ectobacillus ponti]|uniref:Membrane protein n=1 Tax=Ectobacillus ponti TaxID=2961894 RepID=A0AA42BQ41_9BACI|nr:membrane protein [Ectobacillus ponti]MCP8969910.1 membrane protein [Ectobacillus ponti]
MKLARFFFFIFGIVTLTLGVALTLKANLGAGPWDALTAGAARTFGFTVGTWVIINGVVLLFVNAYLLQERPQFLAGITFVLIGLLVDFWLLKVLGDWQPQGIILRAGVLLAGVALLAFGISMYLQSQYPVNPIDNLMIALHKRFHVNLMVAKTVAEISALVFAVLLKGPIGAGTLIVAFTIGPLIQLSYQPLHQLLQRFGS